MFCRESRSSAMKVSSPRMKSAGSTAVTIGASGTPDCAVNPNAISAADTLPR